ncbi:MAG TPA: hypothetical protein VK678_18550, partial [Bradyrhizobium sp.]|nr:hypothetical protein [Bradyrhizobium sp.]
RTRFVIVSDVFDLLANRKLRHRKLLLERFPAKWIPVRAKKTRQNKEIEPRSDSIGTEKALESSMRLYLYQQAVAC